MVFLLADGNFALPISSSSVSPQRFVIVDGPRIPQGCSADVAVRELRECADRIERAARATGRVEGAGLRTVDG